MDVPDLPLFELAYPGPLRDQLVAAVLDGSKTSTSSLLEEYDGDYDPLPVVGKRSVMVDSHERPVGIVETVEVRLLPLGEVDLPFAEDEGEGYTSVAHWREAHEGFWRRNVPGVRLTDETSWWPSDSSSSSAWRRRRDHRGPGRPGLAAGSDGLDPVLTALTARR